MPNARPRIAGTPKVNSASPPMTQLEYVHRTAITTRFVVMPDIVTLRTGSGNRLFVPDHDDSTGEWLTPSAEYARATTTTLRRPRRPRPSPTNAGSVRFASRATLRVASDTRRTSRIDSNDSGLLDDGPFLVYRHAAGVFERPCPN